MNFNTRVNQILKESDWTNAVVAWKGEDGDVGEYIVTNDYGDSVDMEPRSERGQPLGSRKTEYWLKKIPKDQLSPINYEGKGDATYSGGGYDPNVRGWSGVIGPGVKRGKRKSKQARKRQKKNKFYKPLNLQDPKMQDLVNDLKSAMTRNAGGSGKRLKEYMNVRPGDDSPMGATVHHYDAPKDLSPLTLQLLQLFSSQSGQAPADPEKHHGVSLFRQWPEHIQDLVLSDLSFLANKVPDPELRVNLTNMEKFLQLMRGK